MQMLTKVVVVGLLRSSLNIKTNHLRTVKKSLISHHCCEIFLDLKKAFDTVNQNILIANLREISIGGQVNTKR